MDRFSFSVHLKNQQRLPRDRGANMAFYGGVSVLYKLAFSADFAFYWAVCGWWLFSAGF
jgi:hypothetical protein